MLTRRFWPTLQRPAALTPTRTRPPSARADGRHHKLHFPSHMRHRPVCLLDAVAFFVKNTKLSTHAALRSTRLRPAPLACAMRSWILERSVSSESWAFPARRTKMHPRATKVDIKQMCGCQTSQLSGGFSGPSPGLPTVTALKVLIRRCGRPIRPHLDRIGCAFRGCALGCGPCPSSPAMGNAHGGPNKRRCRRRRAARLHGHRRPGRDGTSTCETRCGSGGASGASRAAPAVCAERDLASVLFE